MARQSSFSISFSFASIKAFKRSVWNYIWRNDIASLGFFHRTGLKTLRMTYAIARDLGDGQLSMRAMSLVYTTIIALVPMLAMSFAVLKGFGAHNEIRPLLLTALEPLGDKRLEVTDKIISFVDNIDVGVLGSVGLAILLYTVISMMQKIEQSFNYVWHVSQVRTLAQRVSDYTSVLFIGPLLITASVGTTASLKKYLGDEAFIGIPIFGDLLAFVLFAIPYFIMAIGFAFFYFYIPNARVKIASALVGGLVTAIAWKTMGWAFTSFVATSARHTAVYSAFASAFLFMIWLYIGWLVLLIGSSIAFYFQYPQNLLIRADRLVMSNRVQEKLALLIMATIGQKYYENGGGYRSAELAKVLRTPILVTERILATLVKAGLLVRNNDKRVYYLPNKPLDNMTVYEVLEVIRSQNEQRPLEWSSLPSHKDIDRIFQQASQSFKTEYGRLTIAELAHKTEPPATRRRKKKR